MPNYEYECDECGERFELIQKFSDEPVTSCPSCGGKVRKVLSSPAIQFKGTGWYITDYARKPSAEQAASSEGTEKSSTDENRTKSDTQEKEKGSASAKTASSDASLKPAPSSSTK